VNVPDERRVFAIVSLLDEEAKATIHALWRDLEEACGLKAIKIFPIPHFTWQGADYYDISLLEAELEKIARLTPPLVVHTEGLGLFTGPSPVIYLPLVNGPAMLRFHQDMWERVHPMAHNPNRYYAPGTWIPHISLALRDVTHANIGCAMLQLAFRPLNLTLHVNNLALVYQIGDQVGQLYRSFELTGESCI
jgi:hypothetical protein